MATTTAGYFVGRDEELLALSDLLGAARRGRGSVAAIVGEPGVGKTRTAEVFAARARAAGATVAWGTCYPDWPAPLRPWLEALTPLAGGSGAEQALRAAEGLAGSATLVPEEAQLRVFEAFVDLLRERALGGLVLVLDDVHAADHSSLALLRYVARALPDLAAVLVLTYRTAEMTLTHPLAATLAEVERTAPVQHLALTNLAREDVAELLRQAAGGPVPVSTVEAIHRETDGNAFFVCEVIRSLGEEGRDLTAASEILIKTPRTVRQAVARRLGGLAADTHRAVSAAAAFGGPFSFAALAALTGIDDDRLADSLDEAVRASVLRASAREDAYEFAHPLVRQSLYEETSPGRRARLHRRAAEALERAFAGDADESAGEIALQYAKSASLPGASHGIRFARLAAEQARRRHAYDEAADFLAIARELSASSRVSVRAAILCELAVAEAEALRVAAAAVTVEDALAELEQAGAGATSVATFIADAAWSLKDAGAAEDVLAPFVARGLALLGQTHDLTWARLKLVLNPVERGVCGHLHYGRWLGFDPEAVAIARSDGTEDDYARTLTWFDVRPEEIEGLLERVRRWRVARAKIHGLTVVALASLYGRGDFEGARAITREALSVSERVGSLFGEADALLHLAEIAAALGDFADARDHLERARRLLARLGPEHRLRSGTSNAEEYLLEYVGGDWRGVAELYSRLAFDPSFGRPWLGPNAAAIAAFAYVRLGEPNAAGRLLDQAVAALAAVGPTVPTAYGALERAVAAAWELRSDRHVSALTRLVRAARRQGSGDRPLALIRARVAALAGDASGASLEFDRAREALTATGQRPLRAIVDYDEALALHRAGEPGAEPLLAAAQAQFEELGMTWWLERAADLEREVAEWRRYPAGLTQREAEILALVARGARNSEIAETLHVSVHTVERHLANIYAKIDARNRSEATAYALNAGLS